MKKRDFIQQASIEFLPQLKWDIDIAINYAERLWIRMSERGFGEPKLRGPLNIPNAYDQLRQQPMLKAQFDLFWVAFDYKVGRDKAAARWLQMGEQTKEVYDQIIAGAKRTASNRKKLPDGQIAKMAEGWLSDKRWQDLEETSTETAKKQQIQQQQAYQLVAQDLAHAKKMAAQTSDSFWQDESEKLTEQLRKLRDQFEQRI